MTPSGVHLEVVAYRRLQKAVERLPEAEGRRMAWWIDGILFPEPRGHAPEDVDADEGAMLTDLGCTLRALTLAEPTDWVAVRTQREAVRAAAEWVRVLRDLDGRVGGPGASQGDTPTPRSLAALARWHADEAKPQDPARAALWGDVELAALALERRERLHPPEPPPGSGVAETSCVLCGAAELRLAGGFVPAHRAHDPDVLVELDAERGRCPASGDVPWRRGVPGVADVRAHLQFDPDDQGPIAVFQVSHMGRFLAVIHAEFGIDGVPQWGFHLPSDTDGHEHGGAVNPSPTWFLRPIDLRTGSPRRWLT